MISSPAMLLVGLTGGIATGKSTVAKMLKQCGAVIIDADRLAREVVEPAKPAWRAIVKTFGRTVLNSNRTVNRHALGYIVFRNRAKLRQLERIIHPRVAQLQAQLTRQAARKNPKAVVVYDVPLLFEIGVDKRVDQISQIDIERLKRTLHKNVSGPTVNRYLSGNAPFFNGSRSVSPSRYSCTMKWVMVPSSPVSEPTS